MSRENADLVRRFVESYPRKPERALDWASEFFDPNADYYPVRKFPEARPCHGRDEIARFQVQFIEAWEVELAIEQVTPIDDARVLAHLRPRTEGRESGMTMEGDLWQCVWLRHGQIIRLEDHLTGEGALHALGMSDRWLPDASR